MGLIINIDEALKLRSTYNIIGEPLNKMLADIQEAWEKQNPIDMIFNRTTMSTFQETYVSNIGFAHAFRETADYTVGPIYNTAEGFTATFRTRTFQGGFIITQQVIEDRQYGRAKDDGTAFMKRWHGDVVEYSIASLAGGFGADYYWGEKGSGYDVSDAGEGYSRLRLDSADTVDGDIMNTTKNPLFYKAHMTVKRDKNSTPISQSNIFAVKAGATTLGLTIGGSDAGQISKLADIINQVITIMENYKDDNGKRAGVIGPKTIVAGNDPHLKAALATALSTDVFKQGETMFPNPALNRATLEVSPYFLDIPQCAGGVGFFIVDKSYNASNHGLELTERIPLTLEVFQHREAPQGIKYEGRQRFDINVASWRGVAYVYLGTGSTTATDWNYNGNGTLTNAKFEVLTPAETIVRPVSIVGTVQTSS